MYPTIQETGNLGGKMTNEQRQLQQAQQQMQQMAQQMAQMQAQLQESQRPVAKSYTFDQVQILMSCETINHVLTEFDLSEPKAMRMRMARDYLFHLGDLKEFLPRTTQQQEYPEPEPEEEYLDEPMSDEGELEPERPSNTEIDEINRKMASLKQEEAVRTVEKGKSGIDKIKEFISKKNTTPEVKPDTSMQSESMG